MNNQVEKVAASLWIKPCTEEQLARKLSWAYYSTHIVLQCLKDKKWCYQKGEVWYTYKSAAKILQKRQWDVDPNKKFK